MRTAPVPTCSPPTASSNSRPRSTKPAAAAYRPCPRLSSTTVSSSRARRPWPHSWTCWSGHWHRAPTRRRQTPPRAPTASAPSDAWPRSEPDPGALANDYVLNVRSGLNRGESSAKILVSEPVSYVEVFGAYALDFAGVDPKTQMDGVRRVE